MSYELRECRGCGGSGEVIMDAIYDAASGQLTQILDTCPTCKGVGSVPLYLYAPVSRADMRKATVEMLTWWCWNGSTKERQLAEKELRRRGE